MIGDVEGDAYGTRLPTEQLAEDSEDVRLGDDAHQFISLYDRKPTDVVLRHSSCRRFDGLIGLDGDDGTLQDIGHGAQGRESVDAGHRERVEVRGEGSDDVLLAHHPQDGSVFDDHQATDVPGIHSMHGLGERGFRGDGFHTAGHAHFYDHWTKLPSAAPSDEAAWSVLINIGR